MCMMSVTDLNVRHCLSNIWIQNQSFSMLESKLFDDTDVKRVSFHPEVADLFKQLKCSSCKTCSGQSRETSIIQPDTSQLMYKC